ncbi:uncharacterized protein [Clytia hemisphaerica]|uniref:VWFA domain-containing protein n=1 Tax=Clytia hemisphaerica TaxID=252671 RepID=A0A7M5U0C1_9CNID|eukprot:TCONS_00065037-protein
MQFYRVLLLVVILNVIAQNHCHRKNHSRKRRIKNGSGVAEKIDLVFIIDESEGMSKNDFEISVKAMYKLLKHFSISPGTTRVGLYTVGRKFKKHFEFRDHVNRECVMKSIRKLVLKTSPRNKNFTENLRTGFDEIKEKHTDIEGQRLIYLYITNKPEDVKLINSEVELENGSEMTVLLLEKAVLLNEKHRHHKTKAKERSHSSHHKKETSKRTPVSEKPSKKVTIERAGSKIQVVNLPVETEHILYKINVENKQYGVCEHKKDGSPVMDECDRHCTCVNQKLTNCYRLRKEFTSMTSEERRRYLKAYKTLTTKSPYKDTYERFIFMHYKYFCWGIHNREMFLPWHRWYLSIMEDLLRQIDCGITIPYWDWSYASHDPWNRTNLWRSSDDGLGPNGNRYKGYCVQKGLFRESQWKTPYWEDPMDIVLSSADQLGGDIEDQRGHLAFCLRRAFKGHTPSYISVQRTLLLPARHFKDFDIQMRHNFHDRVHNTIGGTMCTHYAADTPEFHFHHSFLDKIWFKWQSISSDHKWVHFLQRNHTKMLGTEYNQFEYTNCDNLPRCIKVTYKDFPNRKHTKRHRERRSPIDIDSMGRMTKDYWQSYLNDSWYSSFPNCSRSKIEKKRAKFLHSILDGPGEASAEDLRHKLYG